MFKGQKRYENGGILIEKRLLKESREKCSVLKEALRLACEKLGECDTDESICKYIINDDGDRTHDCGLECNECLQDHFTAQAKKSGTSAAKEPKK